MSCTVSANIIFVHAQKFPVTVRSPKLLFPHTVSHSLRRLALSDASHPQSNQRLEWDQIVVIVWISIQRPTISLFMFLLLSVWLHFCFPMFRCYSDDTAVVFVMCCLTRYGVGASCTYRVKTCRIKPLMRSLEVSGLFCLQMSTNQHLVSVLLTRPCPPRNTSVSAPDCACPA